MSDEPRLEAQRYADGTVSCPPHPRGLSGAESTGTIDLTDRTAEVITWTTSMATPPGVREPNTLAFVEFDVDGESVRMLGQIAEDADVEIGDTVEPVYADELREPGAGIREPESQDWDGFRFEPV